MIPQMGAHVLGTCSHSFFKEILVTDSRDFHATLAPTGSTLQCRSSRRMPAACRALAKRLFNSRLSSLRSSASSCPVTAEISHQITSGPRARSAGTTEVQILQYEIHPGSSDRGCIVGGAMHFWAVPDSRALSGEGCLVLRTQLDAGLCPEANPRCSCCRHEGKPGSCPDRPCTRRSLQSCAYFWRTCRKQVGIRELLVRAALCKCPTWTWA